jgi:hypothetical protein
MPTDSSSNLTITGASTALQDAIDALAQTNSDAATQCNMVTIHEAAAPICVRVPTIRETEMLADAFMSSNDRHPKTIAGSSKINAAPAPTTGRSWANIIANTPMAMPKIVKKIDTIATNIPTSRMSAPGTFGGARMAPGPKKNRAKEPMHKKAQMYGAEPSMRLTPAGCVGIRSLSYSQALNARFRPLSACAGEFRGHDT